jgi:hypothetical protein
MITGNRPRVRAVGEDDDVRTGRRLARRRRRNESGHGDCRHEEKCPHLLPLWTSRQGQAAKCYGLRAEAVSVQGLTAISSRSLRPKLRTTPALPDVTRIHRGLVQLRLRKSAAKRVGRGIGTCGGSLNQRSSNPRAEVRLGGSRYLRPSITSVVLTTTVTSSPSFSPPFPLCVCGFAGCAQESGFSPPEPVTACGGCVPRCTSRRPTEKRSQLRKTSQSPPVISGRPGY